MDKLYKIGWNIIGCFEMIGFVICKFIGELVSLIGLGFSSAGSGLTWLADLCKNEAENAFERDPELIQVIDDEADASVVNVTE